jgi:hypothetical protein
MLSKSVNPELAKLLREKGFDYHFEYHDFADYYDYCDTSVQGRLHVSDFEEDKFPDNNKWTPVPYIYQVVDWFYTKHGFWVQPTICSDKTFKIGGIDLNNTPLVEYIISSKTERLNQFQYYYNSLYEAYEAAFTHLLNNVIE